MAQSQYDLIIVGGGIGGSALATVMARAGRRVLVLERQATFRDRVRGEWMAQWGVREAATLGLLDDLMAAGAHRLTRHRLYGDSIDPASPEELPLDALTPDVGGPLTFGHPTHCETLFKAAGAAGATALRPVSDLEVTLGGAPRVGYTYQGGRHAATARLIIGADGRHSVVRKAAGIGLRHDETHHLFAGMLVQHADGWDQQLQVLCTERDVFGLVFPQGGGRIRLYLGYPKEQTQRFAGDGGQRAFLDAFRMKTMPGSDVLANATPAGPCASYPNERADADAQVADGCVLIGDAAGWNDPIIGQGLSITYRDVRMVRDVLLASDDWSPAAFAPYVEERRERMERLRFSAAWLATLANEFGEEARARRLRTREREAANPLFRLPLVATLIGPENVPPQAFDPSLRQAYFA